MISFGTMLLFLTLTLSILTYAIAGIYGDEMCVVGCTPYVDLLDPKNGIEKYKALAQELAETCDIIVHIGDTKPGKTMGCNETTMTHAIHILVDAGAKTLLYAPGDNELNDCHRMKSAPVGERHPSEILKASEAREFLVKDLSLRSGFDVTGNVNVVSHDLSDIPNPASCDEDGNNCQSYSCDFDKYIEMDHFAVATLEVIGSHWYLDDETNSGYPFQDQVDPLKDRLAMYVNAKDCALDWIEFAAETAYKSGKRAVFFMLHATFYSSNGAEVLGTRSIGDFYNENNLEMLTSQWQDPVRKPYKPLYDKLEEISKKYYSMNFQIVHSDSHRWFSSRFNPTANNYKSNLETHHNMMIHQVEGASRALTMYSRFTVDPIKFQPITVKEEWSWDAYKQEPIGHTWIPYNAPYKY